MNFSQGLLELCSRREDSLWLKSLGIKFILVSYTFTGEVQAEISKVSEANGFPIDQPSWEFFEQIFQDIHHISDGQMKYRLVEKANPLRREEKKWYGNPVNAGKIMQRMIAKQIADKSSLILVRS